MATKKLLVVDDEKDICQLVRDIAESCDFRAEVAYNAADFKNIERDFQPDVIVIDLHLENSDGVELLRFLSEQDCKAAIVLISGYDTKVLSTTMLLGRTYGLNMVEALHKPFKASQLKCLLVESVGPLKLVDIDKIQRAIAQDYLILHYQPQVSIKDNKIMGVEALVRMQFPGETIIYPDQFIPLAEKSDLVKPLTDCVINKALVQAQEWQSRNIFIDMSINLSSKYLDDLTVPDKLEQKVRDNNIEPKSISFELTETAMRGQPKIFMDVLTRLRLKDFNLAMDDFGIGYSSLIELYKMPFNYIKIDKSFIMGLEHENDAQIIVKALINLFHELDIKVVAEGVESVQALDYLAKYECDIAQGYYISKPCTAQAISEFFIKYNLPSSGKNG